MAESAARRAKAGLPPKSISPAAEAAEAVDNKTPPFVQFTDGLKILIKPVPPLIIRDIVGRFPEIPVPVMFMEDLGREEENPNDPDYMEECLLRLTHIIDEITSAFILLGTEIMELGEKLPVDDDTWIEPLETLHLPVSRENKYQRYLDYMRYYALASEQAVAVIVQSVMSVSGVTELEVFRQARNFRSLSQRGTNRRHPSEAAS